MKPLGIMDTLLDIAEPSQQSPDCPDRRALVPWMGVAVSEARVALADADHYREIAGKLRELARLTCSPGIRREMVDLANRYDRRANHFDGRLR
jgi:hypothetical protein